AASREASSENPSAPAGPSSTPATEPSEPSPSRWTSRLSPARVVAVECGPDLVECFRPPVTPVRELVVVAPAPGGDQRPGENAALADQAGVRARVVLGNLLWGVGNIELDRPADAGFEVHEEGPILRSEQVARVRLAVQQLLASAGAADRAAQPAKCGAEKLPVGTGQLWSPGPVVNLSLRAGDPLGDVRRRQAGPAEGGMQA